MLWQVPHVIDAQVILKNVSQITSFLCLLSLSGFRPLPSDRQCSHYGVASKVLHEPPFLTLSLQSSLPALPLCPQTSQAYSHLYSFPPAALTKCHGMGDKEQQRSLLSEFWRLEMTSQLGDIFRDSVSR